MRYGKHIYSKGTKKASPSFNIDQIISNKMAISKKSSHGKFTKTTGIEKQKLKNSKGNARKWRTKI